MKPKAELLSLCGKESSEDLKKGADIWYFGSMQSDGGNSMNYKRIFVIVIDSLGVGQMPDGP